MQANTEDSQKDAKKAEASNIARLISAKRAGWANDSRGSGSVLVERATGCVYLSFDGNSIRRQQRVQYQSADRIDKDKFRDHVGFFEGVVQHMYLDTEGNVTVGIGHLIKDVTAAEGLDFYRRQSKANPHPVHIKNAFDLVRRNREKAEDGASAFKDITHLDLDLIVIEVLFEDDVRGFIEQLKIEYKDFLSYPGLAQMGMLDLIYNIGNERFFYPEFPMFHDALIFRNWLRVAEESHRDNEIKGVKNEKIEDRNIIVNKWFLDAMDKEPFFINVDCPYKSLSEFVF